MAESRVTRGTKITIRQVAEDAGVSTAAVSKVLRDAYGVSDALRAKVLTSIEKLNYRPSTAARGMRGQTYCIGVLLIELRNPFLPEIVDGVKESMAGAGYQTLIGVGDGNTSIERSLIDSMIDMRMDGILLVSPRLSGDLLAKYAKQVPLTVIGHHEAGATAFDTVNSDDALGGRLAAEALIGRGIEDIHMVSMPLKDGNHDVFVQREAGYSKAMTAAGLQDRARIWRIREHPDLPGGVLGDVLDTPTPPRGVFCWSDIHGVELFDQANRRGIAVPEEMALVGYDDTPIAGLSMVGLSSVNQRGNELGRQAGQALLSRIGGRTVSEHTLVKPNLVRRRSC